MSIKELVILSGKGGTGKTSVTGSFAVLSENTVFADCDVDAADLHLVLSPEVKETHEFISGREAVIRADDCTGCGICFQRCRYDAVQKRKDGAGKATFYIDPIACDGCGVCVRACPVSAIDFPECLCGEWYISETRSGPMVHARLGIAADNSGKLVAQVRTEAKRIAEENKHTHILVDGPPGIGCPVIASLTGATMALAVTEPTVSGEHDLKRVLDLGKHFQIPVAVCVNKYDLNVEATERIEALAREYGACIAGRIRYDTSVTAAQIAAKAVVELPDAPAGDDIRAIWTVVKEQLDE